MGALIARTIEGPDRLSAMGINEPSEGMEAINQALWKKHRGETPEHALRYFRQTHGADGCVGQAERC